MNKKSNKTINWKYIIIAYILAVLLSAPFNSFYFADFYQNLAEGTIFYKSTFLPAGIGTLTAAFFALKYDKTLQIIIDFWGNNKLRNSVISIIPLIAFTITGIPNELHINTHLYALIISLVFFIYSMAEEIFWRGYLMNAFQSLGKIKSYLILAFAWWIWHLPFFYPNGFWFFLLLVVGGLFLIGTLAEGTRSYLTTTALHSMMNIESKGGWTAPLLISGAAIIIIWIIIDRLWKADVGINKV